MDRVRRRRARRHDHRARGEVARRRGQGLSAFGAYWNATVVGYVGNALYPGRAGEVLRIAALHHAIRVPPGEALASAFMDRMADVVLLSLMTLYVVAFVAHESFGNAVVGVRRGGGCRLHRRVRRDGDLSESACTLSLHERARGCRDTGAEECRAGICRRLRRCRGLAQPRRLCGDGAPHRLGVLPDYSALWLMLRAFDWSLPVQAAMTVGVFLAIEPSCRRHRATWASTRWRASSP